MDIVRVPRPPFRASSLVRATLLASALLAARSALAAPPAADLALYRTWCARCHGERGDGKGPAAAALRLALQPPRDFTAGRFKLRTTGANDPPSDADLARTIRVGIPGTAMPYFEDLLTPEEIARLVGVVRSFGPERPPGTPLDLGPPVPDSPESRARGARLFDGFGCATCHGEHGAGDGPSAAALRVTDGTRIRAADLTRPWTFKGGDDAADVTLRLAVGLGGTPMPGYLEVAKPAELWDLANFVRSLARAPSLRAAAVDAARRPPGEGQTPPVRGEYVVTSGTCFLCHAQMNPDGSYTDGSFGAGGMRITITHTATVFSRNLTPDPDTGLGGWTTDDLRRALRDGRSRDGRALNPLDMPWTILSALTDADVDAIQAHLAALPPQRNLVSAPQAPGWREGLLDKGWLLVSGGPVRAGFHPGNAGRMLPEGEHAAPARNPNADVIVTVAATLAIVLWLMLRRGRGRLVTAVGLALLIAMPVVWTWPPLRWMPPALVRGGPPFERIAPWFGLPPIHRPPAVAIAEPDVAALAERGRYVATIGTCPLCHTAGPSVTRPLGAFPEMGGGMQVSWKVFGTTWSRNLTPDQETGLGKWSAAEIKRAVTSGLSRDGRVMHWQAMPWDHFANLSPEDLEALVVYLQLLPPVRSAVPAPIPPRGDEPDGDTFWFAYGGTWQR